MTAPEPTDPPTLRDRAIDAAKQAINAGGYWLPPAGQEAAVDAVLGLVSPSALPDVQGRCPACRGESLFLGDGGYVTCSRSDCPDPEAATRWLEGRIDYSKIREIGPGPEIAYLNEVMQGIDTWEPAGLADLSNGAEWTGPAVLPPPTPIERALDILGPDLRAQPLYRKET